MSLIEPSGEFPLSNAKDGLPQVRESELRTDALTGRQVIVAAGRGDRPHDQPGHQSAPSGSESLLACPLCPGNEEQTPPPVLTLTQPGSSRPWAVRVVPNLYPLVSKGHTEASSPALYFPRRGATGMHELVVETPMHNQDWPDREAGEVEVLLDAFQGRLRDLEARPATRHVVIFKNKGVEAGASLEHPHSQIVALDFVPAEVGRRVQVARRHYKRDGTCLLCDVIVAERREGARVIFETDGLIAFSPCGSSSAGQALLVPLVHAPSFTTAPPDVREDLGRSLKALLGRAREAFHDPPYNLVLQTAPKRYSSDPALHWYWQLSPLLTRTAGFELGTGLNVNPLPPEQAASLLRETAGAVRGVQER